MHIGVVILAAAVLSAESAELRVHEASAKGLVLSLLQTSDGVRLHELRDTLTQRDLMIEGSAPLFVLTLRAVGKKEEMDIDSNSGWDQATVEKHQDGFGIRWADHVDERFRDISVVAEVREDEHYSGWRWSLKVDNGSNEWSVWQVRFPQLTLRKWNTPAVAVFPRGPGEMLKNPWEQAFEYHNVYPEAWCSMQFMALYSSDKPAGGLYFAVHDPLGGVKTMNLVSDDKASTVNLRFDIPAPNMGIAGNDFELPGEAVWRLFRGDWFDASIIYRDWVRGHAAWYPALTRNGRADTPTWMRELCAWAQTGGAPGDCVESVKAFQKYLDVPVGFHWYNWHQIPFDNDYPHYFPTKDGVADAVKELQQSQVYVMPYINGRLWDTRDRGAEDFEFTNKALSAATKDEDGLPRTESYGSKESDGSPVKLAVMCPTTPLWQSVVHDTVLRLMNECGTSSVYIDQIAAAPPVLCLDSSHGHPLGGGAWWNQGYWGMLDSIRKDMPPDHAITTECNAEPFVNRLDAYLTWHWQRDGQIPMFPTVYGGALQMFGRAYRGGDTKDLALRMKAGQQLVFGEQIGWLDPAVIREPDNGPFLRQTVKMRHVFRRYFYAGEMARPPSLEGEVPTVKADWQWHENWWVTTDSILTGAWVLPNESQLVLLFVNVGDAPFEGGYHFDLKKYARGKRLSCLAFQSTNEEAEIVSVQELKGRRLSLPPRSVFALEFSW